MGESLKESTEDCGGHEELEQLRAWSAPGT